MRESEPEEAKPQFVGLRLTEGEKARLEAIGEGNISEGVRRALAAFGGKSEDELAGDYANYLKGIWDQLNRKATSHQANMLWIASRMKKDWGADLGAGMAARVLAKLEAT